MHSENHLSNKPLKQNLSTATAFFITPAQSLTVLTPKTSRAAAKISRGRYTEISRKQRTMTGQIDYFAVMKIGKC